ncbi:circularly permuted type 2 ATP-grasp protein [Arenibacter sp. F26102]|uniref:circularly permuted type 2 ATP-grasp protein n=1 Tax=Arenibacter sp. F26102 TaxID=2926416 RepID=UPI001FF1102C|nr:circularly permuted type 2 ATP-grasp protein [Arenibacter sp. F26102]MCK0145801.1 circularly permuted type 2 ATP-grasp protein [Arenibacter sp. F26102]
MNSQITKEDLISSFLNKRVKNNSLYFDEITSPDGSVLPHWQRLLDSYNKLGKNAMDERELEVERQLKENGVTYNIYGDPNGMNRPWALDAVPMVFSEEDWKVVESGLKQRTTLLNHILKDIYGHRTLIRSGHIPFELIYNHQGFLRQVDKLEIPGEQQLIQYSADLARGPNGKMWVLHDRTDAPSGAGYTFENRVAMTRVFPEMIRENQIRKINTYYQTLKKTITNLAWQNKEEPRVVFLSPGSENEAYFEHAYLSSLMGFTLVSGADLTVSDGYVWLKTIKGLKKVDVIVRRVDDVFCDPLEFKMNSQLGVVGLMESIRQNKVMVINPLGSRILENPGLMAFLPKLCKHILGEDLILPSVATWWCGQESAKQYVFDNITKLIIRKIYRDNTNRSVYGSALDNKQLEALKDEINTRPYLYVGQETVNFSTTPSYIDGKFESRNAVFRSYVVADTADNSYQVMPGGLTRSSAQEGTFIVSNQSGGISKDTWVLGSDKHVKKDIVPHAILQTENVLPSSTAEKLFWLGRYVERSIFLVRLARVIIKKYYETEDNLNVEKDIVLCALLKAFSNITLLLPGFEDKKTLISPEKELISIITDVTKTGSLNHSLQAFLRNAYAVRDRLGLDTWRILDNISEESNQLKNSTRINEISHILDGLIIRLMAYHGLGVDTMTRDISWNLQGVGRYLESSSMTCTFLKNILSKEINTETEKSLLECVLINNESLITYRYMYRSTIEFTNALSLLMLNELNPRSLVYQISQIEKRVSHLPSNSNSQLGLIQKKLLEATTLVRLSDPAILKIGNKKSGRRMDLLVLMEKLELLLGETSGLIINRFFNHTESTYGFVSTKIPEI